jgi:TolB protein
VVGLAAYAAGGALTSHGDTSLASVAPASVDESPSARESATVPAQAAASPSQAALASRSISSGLIAVVDDSGALVTLDEQGGSRVSYPAPGVVFGFPAWSPDGSRIAVVGQGATDAGIYVFTVNRATGVGGEPTVVYQSPDRQPFYLYWTPDSRHVSFLTNEPGGIALRVAPIDGGAPLDGNDKGSIIRRGAPLYFEWVDTDRLLLHVGGGSDAFVGQVGLDGTTVGSPVVATGNFRLASLSHDGHYLAYSGSDTASPGDIVVETADGSASQRLKAFGPAAMLFDPTGDTLATNAADKPVTDALPIPRGPLRLLDPSSGAARTLLDGPVVAFFWAPDGRTIAALRVVTPGQGPAAVVGGATLAAARISEPQADGTAAAVGAAVGLSFVDVSTGAVSAERVVLLADDFVGQLLPYFDQYALSHPLWSPDGASILLPLVDSSGGDHVAVVPADGSDPRAGGVLGGGGPGGGRPPPRLGSPHDRRWFKGILEPVTGAVPVEPAPVRPLLGPRVASSRPGVRRCEQAPEGLREARRGARAEASRTVPPCCGTSRGPSRSPRGS